MDYSNVRALADKWRNDNPGHDGGVVLIWIDQAYGWKSTLRDPENERPGVLAVDQEGSIYKAEGGNEYDGAEFWLPVGSHITPTIYRMVYEYSHKSEHPASEAEQNQLAVYFNELVTRLMRNEAVDADTLMAEAKAAGVSVLRIPEITRFLNDWGKE